MPSPLPSLYFENSAGEVLTAPAGFLRTNWSSQKRNSESTRAIFENMLRALQHRGWSRILVNQQHMIPFTPDEQRWIAHEWLPRAVQAGYRHGAVVVSPNVLVRLATAFVTTSIQGMPLVYRSFDTDTDARRWLDLQPATPQ
ncbi:MAG: hypothetical protein JWP58_1603 [Hymenobacter sp.]|nr:hypothetical protein [Hymenobacter sp.]